MSWWDNLVGAFWILLQAILWIGAIVLAALVVGAVILGVWQHVKRSKEPARQTLLNTAEATALSRYRNEHDPDLHIEAFKQGADYMWEHLHPKK